MAYTNITKPDAGSATRKTTVDALIDNDAYFQSVLGSNSATGVANGSFEFDTDGDGYPDQWTWSAQTAGAGTVVTSPNGHGDTCFRITQTTGGSDGGGTLTSSDYFEVSEYERLTLQWLHYNTRAAARDIVKIQFYTSALASISTTTIYTSVTNPTAWDVQFGWAMPPATARFAKIIITGSDSSSTGASVSYWDDFKFVAEPQVKKSVVFDYSTTTAYITVPTGVTRMKARVWAGGGGGGGGGGTGGGGGGGGGYAEGIVAVTAGTRMTVTRGAGGAASVGAGNAGGTSSFSTISATGGSGGAGGAFGAGGAGGVGTGDITVTGQTGIADAVGVNGDGGASQGGFGGRGDAAGGGTGQAPGGGGGASGATSGAGGAGKVILEW